MNNIHQLLIENPDLFPPEKLSLKLMIWAYETVMTRIFGYSKIINYIQPCNNLSHSTSPLKINIIHSNSWSLPSSCMIPYADMFNHSADIPVDHYLVDLKREREYYQENNEEKKHKMLKGSYKIKSDKIDLSIFKEELL